MIILVTGANGQLGSEIKKTSVNYSHNWVFTGHDEFDLSDLSTININLSTINPNIIINCCAYTDVDEAEDNYEPANILNHDSIKLIAKWSYQNNCKLIHISTDYVYDGTSKFPIKENTLTNPLNIYGKTKLLGDNACIFHNPEAIIIRTSWLYSSFGNNFVKKMISLMQQKNKIYVINDQIGSPTYAADLAKVLLDIIDTKTWISGIYNYTNEAKISWFDLANDIKLLYGFNTIINAVTTKQYSQKAERPIYSVLDITKIKITYNIKALNYKDSLKKCIKIIKDKI